MRFRSSDTPVSLRRYLAWWMIPSLAVILMVAAFWSHSSAEDAADLAYDRSLTTAIKSIAENIHADDESIFVDIPYSAMDLSVEGGVQERIFYAIIGPNGRVLTGYEDLKPPPEIWPPQQQPLLVDSEFRGHDIRLGIFAKRLYAPEFPNGDAVTILFAETTEARTHLAWHMFLDSLRRQLLLIAAVVLPIMFAVSRAFSPLMDLRESIRQRKAEDLTPVPVKDVPTEVLPLIEAINSHIARLGKMLQARRRFLADAAHQIRTPLAVLGMQAEYGGRQDDPDEMRRTFGSMLGSIRGTRHMANQMLTLARAEQAGGLIPDRASLGFAALVRDVAGDFAALALEKNIDLAFEGGDDNVLVSGNAIMLREMVSNLVDNGVRYTGAGGYVTLAVRHEDGCAVLSVADNGPGIPSAERDRAFRRFYRILGNTHSEGSGLGLCIAREICHAHGGTIRLADGPQGTGLSVEVALPAVAPRARNDAAGLFPESPPTHPRSISD